MQIETIKPGMALFSRDEARDDGLWLLFHHDKTGSAAIDLTTAHPELTYDLFKKSMSSTGLKPHHQQIILLGGPERGDDALIILHETTKESPDSNILNDQLSFLAYRLVRIPGEPPVIETVENAPTEIKLNMNVDFLISVGYRTWSLNALENEIKSGLWNCLPPETFDIFNVPHENRRNQILKKLN